MPYQFKTDPFAHQLLQFERSKELEFFGILWEQGTGKTKLAIDNAAYLYTENLINGLLIVAPNVIHQNWVTNEIPAHMPDEIFKRSLSYVYHSSKVKTKKHANALFLLNKHDEGLAILAMTYDALACPHGKKAARTFLQKRDAMTVADESTRIKTPRARRTRAALDLTLRSMYRRVLTGTPVDNSPFDVYSQMKFLHPQFWDGLGISTFQGFKTKFGTWVKGWNGKTQREFDQLVCHKNLDKLKEYMMVQCSRVTKDEVLDLPEKLYSTLTFDLSPKQRRVYDQMAENFLAILEDGSMSSTDLVITQLLRLQQIANGYLVDDTGKFHIIDEKNSPRIDLLCEQTEDLPHQAIIWGRFRKDVDLICDALGKSCRRADGQVKAQDRLALCDEFQAGGFQFIVSNPAALGEGVTLTRAKSVFYYANGPKLGHRLQSEDRAHRISQDGDVHYVDQVARDTTDEDVVDSLLRKIDVASQVTGDILKKWITKSEKRYDRVL